MTTAGLVMMIVSYVTVSVLFLYCIVRVMMDPKPVEVDPPEASEADG